MAKAIYLFYGSEDWLIQEKLKELIKKIPNPELNVEKFDGQNPELEAIIGALQNTPLLGGEKLVIIERADLGWEGWEKLLPHLQALAPETKVILWTEKADKRTKLYKALAAQGEVYEFMGFAEWEQEEVVAWIRQRAKLAGGEINSEAAESLRAISGNALGKLASEIDKLVTYVGEGKTIDETAVFALASPGTINTFALSDAILEKNIIGALSTFRLLYKNKTDLFSLLGLLASNYRLLLQVKQFPPSSAQPRSIAAAVGANPYFVKKCLGKATKFKEQELQNNLELILQTDLNLKSGWPELPTLELLITSLCLPSPAKDQSIK